MPPQGYLQKRKPTNAKLTQNAGSLNSRGGTAPVPKGILTPADGGYNAPMLADASAMIDTWKADGLTLTDETLAEAKDAAKFYTSQASKTTQYRAAVKAVIRGSVKMAKNFAGAASEVLRGNLAMHQAYNRLYDVADSVGSKYRLETDRRRKNHQVIEARHSVNVKQLNAATEKRLSMLYGGKDV